MPMNREQLEERLAELPLYAYFFLESKDLVFTDRVRWICTNVCQMSGKTWACRRRWARWRKQGKMPVLSGVFDDLHSDPGGGYLRH